MGLIAVIFTLFRGICGLIITLLIVHVVLSWLISFNMVSPRNQIVASLWDFTTRLSNPLLRPFRKLIPPISGFDLSVMVVLFILYFVQGPVSIWLEGVLTGRGPLL
jgi:YggT family protein